jgi:hypothetical protein
MINTANTTYRSNVTPINEHPYNWFTFRSQADPFGQICNKITCTQNAALETRLEAKINAEAPLSSNLGSEIPANSKRKWEARFWSKLGRAAPFGPGPPAFQKKLNFEL